jgi:hypothetical protein
MVRLRARSHKLAPIYEGPYLAIRKTQGGPYILKDEQDELLHREYVPSELKVVSLDESEFEDEFVEVEEVWDHRGSSRNKEYRVKWKGLGEKENSWVPAKDFKKLDLIHEYEDKIRKLTKDDVNKSPQNQKKRKYTKQNKNSNNKRPRGRPPKIPRTK